MRRSLFLALTLIACGTSFGDTMPATYNGNPSGSQLGSPVAITTPSGGDAPNAAGVNVPLGTLADYVEALRRRWALVLASAVLRTTNFTAPTNIAVCDYPYGQGFAGATDKGAGVAGVLDISVPGGMTWQGGWANPAVQSYLSIASSPAGAVVAVGYNGQIVTQPPGNIFATQVSGTANTLRKVRYGNGLFVAVGDGGTLLTSPDGITWTSRAGLAGTPTALAYVNGLWVVGYAAGALVWKADPTAAGAWSSGSDARISTVRGIAYGNGTYAVVADNGSLWGADLATYNAAGWSHATDDVTNGANGIVFTDGWFVAAGAQGALWAGQSAANFHKRMQVVAVGTPINSIAYSSTLNALVFATATQVYSTMPLW